MKQICLVFVAVIALALIIGGCSDKGRDGAGTGKAAEPKAAAQQPAAGQPEKEPVDKPEDSRQPVAEDRGPATAEGTTETPAKDTAVPPAGSRKAKVAEGLASPDAPSASEGVVAWKGDWRIHGTEFVDYLDRLPPFQRREYNSLEKKKELLLNLLKFETLANMAREEGLDKDPQVVLAAKTEMVKKYLQNHYGEGAAEELSGEDVKGRYERDHARYHKPERVRASHIFIKDKATAKKVLAALRKALQKPATNVRRTFREFVKAHSEDEATKSRGGDLLFFTLTGAKEGERPIDPAVVNAAFAMQNTDQISGLISGADGHHILLLTNRRKKVEQSFEEVQEEIRTNLKREKLDKKRRDFMDGLVNFKEWNIEMQVLDRIEIDAQPSSSDVKARVESIRKKKKKEQE